MYVTAHNVSRFPSSVEITIENDLDLDLIQRISGLNETIPRNIDNRGDNGKARTRDFLASLKAALDGL